MSRKNILMIGNKLLRKKSESIDFAKDNVEQFIQDLKDTLEHIQKEKNRASYCWTSNKLSQKNNLYGIR